MVSRQSSTILVTGGAGFIGSHVAKRLLESGDRVIIVDNFNSYYSPKLKEDRIRKLIGRDWIEKKKLKVYRNDIADGGALRRIFRNSGITHVCHLAAQPGVRFYFEKKNAYKIYKESNLDGTINLLELAKEFSVQHFVFASTSSVYGAAKHFPLQESQNTDTPLSLYSATKKANEVIAHTYSYLFNMNITGLRFFNVYGPWGRPDGAYYLWARLISQNKPIKVFGYGKQQRDWTYIDDIVEGVTRVLRKPQGYAIYNIGRGRAEHLLTFLKYIERGLGKTAKRQMLPLQPGEVTKTYCDVTKLKRDHGYQPSVTIKRGVRAFIDWYKDYHGK